MCRSTKETITYAGLCKPFFRDSQLKLFSSCLRLGGSDNHKWSPSVRTSCRGAWPDGVAAAAQNRAQLALVGHQGCYSIRDELEQFSALKKGPKVTSYL
jgi:hypothetical protein